MTSIRRFTAVPEVTSKRYVDQTPIWKEDVFPCRLKSKPLVALTPETENARYLDRIDGLRQTHAAVRFLSLEPLLGPLRDLDLNMIDRVIVGGESGRRPRSMGREWVLEIRDPCEVANVPCFLKQWGGANKRKAGRILDGRTWDALGVVQREHEPPLHSV